MSSAKALAHGRVCPKGRWEYKVLSAPEQGLTPGTCERQNSNGRGTKGLTLSLLKSVEIFPFFKYSGVQIQGKEGEGSWKDCFEGKSVIFFIHKILGGCYRTLKITSRADFIFYL